MGENKEAQQAILLSLHSSGIGGHSGVQGTYQRVKALFSWPALKQSMEQFVKSCSIYQQAKSEHIKKLGLLSPLVPGFFERLGRRRVPAGCPGRRLGLAPSPPRVPRPYVAGCPGLRWSPSPRVPSPVWPGARPSAGRLPGCPK